MNDRTGSNADRAVSELVGYILIFSIVTLAATSVFVLGTTQIENTRDAERVANVEKAFEVLSGNIEDHHTQDATGRATEIRISDGELYLDGEDEINVTIEHGGSVVETYSGDDNPITYESDEGEKVVYSNGAVFREGPDYSWMVHEPRFLIGDERTVLPITMIRGDEHFSAHGSDVVQVRTEQLQPIFLKGGKEDRYNVTVSVRTDPDRAAAWQDYIESHEIVTCDDPQGIADSANAELVCEFTTGEIYVPMNRIDTGFN